MVWIHINYWWVNSNNSNNNNNNNKNKNNNNKNYGDVLIYLGDLRVNFKCLDWGLHVKKII